MKTIMTFKTNRNNIAPIYLFVSKIMMVVLCNRFAMRTLEAVWPSNFASLNAIIYKAMSLNFFWVFLAIFFRAEQMALFMTIACYILFKNVGFTVLGVSLLPLIAIIILLVRQFLAHFAFMGNAVFTTSVFVKFRKTLNFFTSTASFCCNRFRHILFLFRKTAIKVVQDRFLLNSLHYTIVFTKCQGLI